MSMSGSSSWIGGTLDVKQMPSQPVYGHQLYIQDSHTPFCTEAAGLHEVRPSPRAPGLTRRSSLLKADEMVNKQFRLSENSLV